MFVYRLLRTSYSEKLNAKVFQVTLDYVSEIIRKTKNYNNKMTFTCSLLFLVFNLLDN